MVCKSSVFIHTLLICFTSGTYSIIHDNITDNRNMVCPPIVEDSIKKGFLNRIVACSFDGKICTDYIKGFAKSRNISSTVLHNSSFNPSNGDGYIYGSGGVISIIVFSKDITDINNFDIYVSIAYYIHNTSQGTSNVTFYVNGESDSYYIYSTSTWNVFNKRYTFTNSDLNFTLSASGGFMRFDDLCIYQVCKFGYIFNKTTGLCEGLNVLRSALKISRDGISQSSLIDIHRSKDNDEVVGFWIALENRGLYIVIKPLPFYGENVVLTYRFYSSQRTTLRIFYENLHDDITEFNSFHFQEETFENWFDCKSSVRINKVSQHQVNTEKEKKVFDECIRNYGSKTCISFEPIMKAMMSQCNNCFILRITFQNPGAKTDNNLNFIIYLASFNVLLDELKVCPNNLTSNQLKNGCDGCATGYTFNIISGQCEDFDECTILHVCKGSNEVCQNTNGSYNCLCIDGWIMDLLPPHIASAEHNTTCRYNFFGNNSTTCKRNGIALIPKLDKEFIIFFDILPYLFKTNISIIHFTDCYSNDGCNPILHVYIGLNGKIWVLNKHDTYEGGPINETVLTSIEISYVFNNSNNVYKYTIKINEKIVFFKLIYDVQSYKDVKVYASCLENLISNFNLINGIKNNGILPIVIIPTDVNLEKVWIHTNRFMKTQYSYNLINGKENNTEEILVLKLVMTTKVSEVHPCPKKGLKKIEPQQQVPS
ncbi:uncharacterized protein LOC136092889 isoform X1 [Hydra vulgaris]|uniref:uncharacterized protein LOC136092889 isoform X1 n=1 Tax=Hydra vulgaris TaxID=6087 RepID=UPI0032EA7BE4